MSTRQKIHRQEKAVVHVGTIGHSFSSLFEFASSADAVIQFLNDVDDSNMAVLQEGDTWGVLTGDQILFRGGSLRECEDFLFGLLVGGVIFADLAEHPRWRRLR